MSSPCGGASYPAFSLAQQNTRLLAVAFILIELLVAAIFAFFIMLPLARRSADDLAGLMILSAQTWVELPPETRPAFELELRRNHALALRTDAPAAAIDDGHPWFFHLLEDALLKRTGSRQHLARERIDDGNWYWTSLPTGGRQLAVGVSEERIGAQPVMAFALALLGGLTLAGAVAVWLARRITAPLARLEQAVRRVGQGEAPQLLPETGPQELAELARRFNVMARQVRDLLGTRTTLLAGVSHDLRTPLARMRLALEILRVKPEPRLIERLESDIEEMNGLIATLLDLARGLSFEKPAELDSAELLTDMAREFSTPGRSISVGCSGCQQVIAPPRALRRAIGNLLQNALRYAPEGGIELVCEPGASGCRIGVLDRGPGIPPERVESMFQPFSRLDESRSPSTGGAGLGLAIVRELARTNGWKVSLEARAGGGLAAWIELAE